MKRTISVQATCLVLFAIIAVLTTIATPSQAQGRNPWTWPFASNSIWNTPIYTSALYEWAGFEGETNWGYGIDKEYIVYVDDNTPYLPVYNPGSPYRASGNSASYIGSVRVPNWLTIADINPIPGPGFSTPNDCTAFVYFGSAGNSGMTSGSVIESQPTTRPSGSSRIYGYMQRFGSVYGDGQGNAGSLGCHYGSGMSVLGGSIRSGELTSSTPIRHALKINVRASKYLYYSSSIPGYRWPARVSDNYANDPNNPNRYGGTNPKLTMGSLCAIPGWVSVNSLNLSSAKSRKLATALLDYGAYIVDDTADSAYAFCVSQEESQQFSDIPQSDLQKIFKALWIVGNNGPNSIGGKTGNGVPRVGLAPNF